MDESTLSNKLVYLGDSALDPKKKVAANDKDEYRYKNKYENDDDDDVDDQYASFSSYADNRYSAFSPPEGNYRTRTRWPTPAPAPPSQSFLPPPSSSYDDFMNGNDWPRFEFPT
jgi:hypothetical protein